MQNENLKNYLNLHLIVFIWGFTAVLGALISIDANNLVWYRMLLASIFLAVAIVFKKQSFGMSSKMILSLIFTGLLIALHWIFFFKAIKISSVSLTLSVFSLGSFFASLLEPLFYNRKILWYEVFFGLIMVFGLGVIVNAEINYLEGVLYALASIIIGVLFTLINGKLILKGDAKVITFYEFMSGVAFITIYFLFENKFNSDFFSLTSNDWIFLLILSSICTAYAFSASVWVMKTLSPYTVMLTTNLEPVYGIFLAYLLLGEKEKMSLTFYVATAVIVFVVLLNGYIKYSTSKK